MVVMSHYPPQRGHPRKDQVLHTDVAPEQQDKPVAILPLEENGLPVEVRGTSA